MPIPDDWKIIITDVIGSTAAIESGRYRDVNIIGAASITAAQNAMEHEDFPYVFGGDGATLLIPPGKIDIIKAALINLKSHSQEKFELKLRVGMVEVSEIKKNGSVIEIAKHELAFGRCIAVFRGGGLTDAEKMIKGSPDIYELPVTEVSEANLKGLSCRWNNIPSKHGKILSMLVASRSGNPSETYQKILIYLNEVFDGDLQSANPVDTNLLTYKSIRQCYKDEKRYNKSLLSPAFIARFSEIILAVVIFKYKIPSPFFSQQKYVSSMSVHSDFRKFDDMLRMVIDCSAMQIEDIRKFLETLQDKNEVFFGLFESETSIMTCYVQNINDGGHIHFVDGGDGGYAMAAKQLKAQMNKAP